MNRFLVDDTLVLDVLLDREPFAAAAAAVWAAVEQGRAEGLLSAAAVIAVYEQSVRAVGGVKANEMIKALLSVFGVAGVDEAVLRAALSAGQPHFDQAVAIAAAQRAKCAAIVTRRTRLFRKAPIRILTPEEAAAGLGAGPSQTDRPA